MSIIAKHLKSPLWYFLALVSISFTLTNCQQIKVPSKKLSQFDINQSHLSYEFTDDDLVIRLANPLKSPLRFNIKPHDSSLSNDFKSLSSVLVHALKDTIISLPFKASVKPKLNFQVLLGDLEEVVNPSNISLPIKANTPTRIVQGYDATHSHNTDFSRYAIDFEMSIGDTIYAAQDGIVVGVIEDYKYGGEDTKWIGYDNFITLYHSQSGLFTQYAHLVHKGSLVNIGDTVRRSTPIALAGVTGYTDIPHLHFNALKAVDTSDGLISIPVSFMEGLEGNSLKRDDIVERKQD